MTARIGISIYPDDGRDVGELLKNFDLAMYRAKSSGRKNYCFYAAERFEPTNVTDVVELRTNSSNRR